MFCKQCGKILKLGNAEENKSTLCSCGLTNSVSEVSFSETIVQKEEVGKGIYSEAEGGGFPHKCKKCGFEECDVEDLGAFYSDESNVYIYKCKKCGNVERQADGTSNG